MREPSFSSLAVAEGRFHYGDVIFAPLPPGTTQDPRAWAEMMFSRAAMPTPIRALYGLRMLFAGVLGLRPAPSRVFDVCEVCGEEALMAFDDEHLEFRCAVGVDAEVGVVRVTTVVRLHGWRGRVYFPPVSVLHPIIVRMMLNATRRVLAKTSRPRRGRRAV